MQATDVSSAVDASHTFSGNSLSNKSLTSQHHTQKPGHSNHADTALDLSHRIGPSASSSSNSQILKVVVPASCSSLGSSLSSVHDHSSDNDTPATSAAVTPAERNSPKTRTSKQSATSSLPLTSSIKGKRKRLAEDDLLEADEILALTIQDQEWIGEASSDSAKKRQSLKTSYSNRFRDTDTGHCQFEVTSDSSDDDLPSRKRQKKVIRSQLPTRAARDIAKKSYVPVQSRSILDSEEDDISKLSDASAFTINQQDSDGFDNSEYSESDYDVSNEASVASLSAANMSLPEQASSTEPRHRPRRGGGVNGRRRAPRRRWQGLEDRAVKERKKLEKAHPEIITMWEDLRAIPRIVGCQAQQPSTITRELKSFQLEGLDWMIRQENSQWKGGLLGDEMGMGKTIQAVSLIMSDYPAPDPTLVVVPPVALMQWQNEIAQYTDGKLKVLVYHNTNPKVKKLKAEDLCAFNVIMISYSGLESIYRKQSKGWKRDDGLVKENSKIHAIHYHRLILDEAHNIKTRTASVAKACFALQADFKWCLSGTPVQNRIGEFFSLLRFLEIRPFASYFCKKCPCANLHWNQGVDKRCSSCQHTGFEHVSIFNQELLNPITQQGDPGLRRQALQKLRLVTDRIMLRRMKRDYTASMELPPKEVVVHSEFFGEIERDFSSSIMSNTTRQFDTYVSRGVMLNNYANIFGLIMQVCLQVTLAKRKCWDVSVLIDSP